MLMEDKKTPSSPAGSGAQRSSVRPHMAPQRKKKTVTPKRVVIFLIIVALAVAAGFFAYRYNQSQKEVSRLSDPKVAAQKQVSDLVAQVGKLAQLPSSETPTVATVSDVTKLKGQAFFAAAINGDKVLIYTQAKRAVLYRPSENKVIEIAPLNIGSGASSGTKQ